MAISSGTVCACSRDAQKTRRFDITARVTFCGTPASGCGSSHKRASSRSMPATSTGLGGKTKAEVGWALAVHRVLLYRLVRSA